MPKPTRRERRQMAEKGKLAPRRVAPDVALTSRAAVEASQSTSNTLTRRAQKQVAALADAKEYAHIRADLTRIAILAVLLIGAMVALYFVLPSWLPQ